MTLELLVIAVIAALVTVPVVWLVPRARHSFVFDRVLWSATWLLSFLSGWYALGNFSDVPPGLSSLMIAQVPVLTVLVGAAAGAILLNGLLWLMDRLAPPEIDLEPEPAGEDAPLVEPNSQSIESESNENPAS